MSTLLNGFKLEHSVGSWSEHVLMYLRWKYEGPSVLQNFFVQRDKRQLWLWLQAA